MNISIVYDSKTGITKKAAEAMANILKAKGHQCSAVDVQAADPAALKRADMLFLGCWISGLFIILQQPSKPFRQFARTLPDLAGKKVALFCTYKLAVGSSLKKMAETVSSHGGRVAAIFKFRGPQPDAAFEEFAAKL
ncbi:MAG: flavodoxin family protein [candidate division FCPU426 bacterium]